MSAVTLRYTKGYERGSPNVTVELDEMGSIREISRIACNADPHNSLPQNQYLHFLALPESEPTEAQRAVLARVYLGDRSVLPCPGAEVCRWAFAGMDPQSVSAKYGDSRKIYLA